MKRIFFPVKRIFSLKLKSKKGASVMFALIGFMFAAMISLVVVNAAYSAASRVKKLKYDEQAFLLAQSMSGIMTDALSGNGNNILLADGSTIKAPSGDPLKYDGLTVSYQYIELRDSADGNIYNFYNDNENGISFKKSTTTGEYKKTFSTVKGRTSLSDAASSVQMMVFAMCKKIDQGLVNSEETVKETLTAHYPNPTSSEVYDVETVFTMDKSYSINIVTTATVTTSAGRKASKYIVRMDANAVVRTDKLVCVGTKNAADETIITAFEDKLADSTGEELVKVSSYSVTWPPEQINTVYVAP